MPFYDYCCPDCGHCQEELRKVAEVDEPCLCEKCESLCNKVVTAPAGVKCYGSGIYDHSYKSRK